MKSHAGQAIEEMKTHDFLNKKE